MRRKEFILKSSKALLLGGILYSFNSFQLKATALGNKLTLDEITVNNPPDPFNMLPDIENLEYALDITYTGNELMLYATVSGNDPTKLGVEATVEKLANDHFKIHLNFDSYEQLANQNVTVSITDQLVGVNEHNPELNGYSLSKNYPNPFNPSTKIDFIIPTREKVKIDLFDVKGEYIKTIFDNEMEAGKHTVQLDASNLASGVYIYKMRAGHYVKADRMVLTK